MRKQMQECWPRPRTKVESLRSANKDVGRRARKETTDLPRRMLDRAVRHDSNSKFNTYEDLDLAESDRMMSKRRPASTKISILEKTLTTQLIDAAVHAKWMVAARDLSDDEDGEELQWLATTMGPSTAKFLPCMLVTRKLFGSQIKRPLKVALHPFTRETLLMELLAAEHSDEELEDGELEGSGDDYDG
ncbi:hypothetical protein B0H13DRAFT_2278439 [Mycena leptocephala]|nr:hypothetical protein B0H13DRAFT_2278439 [Mycena leptocephala]